MMTAIKIEDFKYPKRGRVESASLRIETIRLKGDNDRGDKT